MSRAARNRFAQPFLVGALGSTLLGGCISSPLSGPGKEEMGERSSTCPADKPLPGTSCEGFKKDLVCATGAKCGESSLFCSADGIWTENFSSCNPPPPARDECPEELPENGASCEGYALNLRCAPEPLSSCPLPDQNESYICDETGFWKKKHPSLSCNPPERQIEECPDLVPAHGSSCFEYLPGLSCAGPERECNGDPIAFRCNEDGFWKGGRSVFCNPPPPMGGAGGESPVMGGASGE